VVAVSLVWGAATSSYQIEGAVDADGRGESVWDRFCSSAGNIQDGSSGALACDHYRRWREDIALMKELGLHAYRFSIAWPRVIPNGRGRINEAGLDFYSRLVDGLLEAGIEPFVTLFHWDLPQALEEQGGWAARSTAEAFADYADVVAKRLGDRVENWFTHNEPWCVSVLGYLRAIHAPGRRDWRAALAASHHLLLSHGWAVPVVRANSPHAEVGIILNLSPTEPASPSEHDHDACRHVDGAMNRWFLDPLHRRQYPADMIADYESAGRFGPKGFDLVQPGDMRAIAERTDFLGVNYYTRTVVRSNRIAEDKNAARTILQPSPENRTEMGWEIYPAGLRDILMRVHLDYRPPKIYVAENGASYSIGPDEEGRVRDESRVRYLRDHFQVAYELIEDGVLLDGYFVWSLLDNFEWERGYRQRFGITWVDFETQRRIPKDSALWYREVISQNAVL
jgi:beta-glucosidase